MPRPHATHRSIVGADTAKDEAIARLHVRLARRQRAMGFVLGGAEVDDVVMRVHVTFLFSIATEMSRMRKVCFAESRFQLIIQLLLATWIHVKSDRAREIHVGAHTATFSFRLDMRSGTRSHTSLISKCGFLFRIIWSIGNDNRNRNWMFQRSRSAA